MLYLFMQKGSESKTFDLMELSFDTEGSILSSRDPIEAYIRMVKSFNYQTKLDEILLALSYYSDEGYKITLTSR